MSAGSTIYDGRIMGNFLTVYRPYFPMTEIVVPPAGWTFRRVTLWRKGLPDECWRILYRRAALTPGEPSP